jgi:hypothetical protein
MHGHAPSRPVWSTPFSHAAHRAPRRVKCTPHSDRRPELQKTRRRRIRIRQAASFRFDQLTARFAPEATKETALNRGRWDHPAMGGYLKLYCTCCTGLPAFPRLVLRLGSPECASTTVGTNSVHDASIIAAIGLAVPGRCTALGGSRGVIAQGCRGCHRTPVSAFRKARFHWLRFATSVVSEYIT